MSGKSTYMRQVALICTLAQLGSFVPAASARVPIVDRVFTRVGASDDIAGGRSTFMVEMTELADILADAGEDSLVILDEVGRGTSTRDGYAIAQAATEHLHDSVGAYTLFATHHHELTDVAAGLNRARNYHFSASKREGGIEFEHDLRAGPAEASYGVEVADMAGVPADVVDRASAVLEDRETGATAEGKATVDAEAETSTGSIETERGESADRRSEPTPPNRTASADGGGVPTDLVADLEAVDLAETTPLEALNLLSRLKSELE
jgi:DNA mismatch repair protein MutS